MPNQDFCVSKLLITVLMSLALPLRHPLLPLAPLLVCYEREGLHDNAQLVVGHIS